MTKDLYHIAIIATNVLYAITGISLALSRRYPYYRPAVLAVVTCTTALSFLNLLGAIAYDETWRYILAVFWAAITAYWMIRPYRKSTN